MAKSELCQGQVDAILKITEENEQRRQEYNAQKEDFDIRYDQYQRKLQVYNDVKRNTSRIPDVRGRYVEEYGKAVDCTSMIDLAACCRDVSLARKKCTLQGDKFNVPEKKHKCSNGGLCTWAGNRGMSCTDPNICADANPDYVRNKPVGNNFPITESAWHKEYRHKYPEPIEPKDEPVLNLEPYPTIICQDCSTSLELIKNTDTLATGLQQITQCINNLDVQENQEPGDENRNDITNTTNESNESIDNGNGNGNGTGNGTGNGNGNGSLFTKSLKTFVESTDWAEENKQFVLDWWWIVIIIVVGLIVFMILINFLFSPSQPVVPMYPGQYQGPYAST